MSKAKKKRFPFFSFFGSKGNVAKANRSCSRRKLAIESMEERRLMALDVLDRNQLVNDSRPAEFVQAGNTLYFVATTRNGRELQYSSVSPIGGIVSSTENEIVLSPGSTYGSEPEGLTVFGGSVYFSAATGSNIATGGGREVWEPNSLLQQCWRIMEK